MYYVRIFLCHSELLLLVVSKLGKFVSRTDFGTKEWKMKIFALTYK